VARIRNFDNHPGHGAEDQKSFWEGQINVPGKGKLEGKVDHLKRQGRLKGGKKKKESLALSGFDTQGGVRMKRKKKIFGREIAEDAKLRERQGSKRGGRTSSQKFGQEKSVQRDTPRGLPPWKRYEGIRNDYWAMKSERGNHVRKRTVGGGKDGLLVN